MIKCIIVDDEPLARQLIVSYIDQIPGLQCVGNYKSAMEALPALMEQQVDVIFIDIEMPGLSGLNLIKALKTHPKVIFITAYTDYAVEAFEIAAADYLVKPVTFERFVKAVQKIGIGEGNVPTLNQLAAEPSSIFLKVDRRLVQIDLSSIIYVEGLGDYLKVHTKHQTYVSYMALGKLEALLPSSAFIRIHRSTIINKSMIQFIEGNFIRINDIDLSIGITYKESLLRSLK
ncbi:LytR/AlgR family response regulator transcription factor [Mucilaginibacter calamicampi]|uniref:LytR/AlgR family response regulator transcription factor n=1 Tax=Mucilaginibacter calamicampi TaxID=1302352 RepID=A0ABW2YVR8_9SPHI